MLCVNFKKSRPLNCIKLKDMTTLLYFKDKIKSESENINHSKARHLRWRDSQQDCLGVVDGAGTVNLGGAGQPG